MSVMEKISKLSKNSCDDALLNCICDNYDKIECELNEDEYKEPRKHNYDFLCSLQQRNIIRWPKIDFSLYETWFM